MQNRCHVSPWCDETRSGRRTHVRIRRERHTRTRDSRRGWNEAACATRVRRAARRNVHRERSLRGTCYTTVTNLVTVRCARAADKALSHDDYARIVNELLGCHRVPITGKVEEISLYVIVQGVFFFFLVSFLVILILLSHSRIEWETKAGVSKNIRLHNFQITLMNLNVKITVIFANLYMYIIYIILYFIFEITIPREIR